MKKKLTLLGLVMLLISGGVKAEVVFNETHDVGSWNAQQLPVASYETFRTVREGDVIAVTVTSIEEGARVTLQNTSWQGLAGCEEYISKPKTCYFVLDATNAAEVKANGLIVTGEKYVFDKVEILYKKILWGGSVNDNTGWGQSDALDKGLFSSLTDGSVIGVTVSAINDGQTWHQYALRYNYASNVIEMNGLSKTGTYFHVLSSDNVSQLQEEGKAINVVAQYLEVTALATYTDFPASISITDTEYPYFLAGEYATVQVSRTLLAGYNTIILPFAATAAELTGKTSSKVYTIKEANDVEDITTLTFVSVDDMEANKPYLIYVEEDTPIAILSDKTLVAIPAEDWKWKNYDYNGKWYLQGVYSPTTAGELVGKYVVSGTNTIQKCGSEATLKGLRAYFVAPSGAGVKSDIRFVIDDTSTAIDSINGLPAATAEYYNLAGQRVQKPQHGVYVVGGRKVVVK